MSSKLQEVNLQIEGMTCAACATRIEKGLNKMTGVIRANVNLALETAAIEEVRIEDIIYCETGRKSAG